MGCKHTKGTLSQAPDGVPQKQQQTRPRMNDLHLSSPSSSSAAYLTETSTSSNLSSNSISSSKFFVVLTSSSQSSPSPTIERNGLISSVTEDHSDIIHTPTSSILQETLRDESNDVISNLTNDESESYLCTKEECNNTMNVILWDEAEDFPSTSCETNKHCFLVTSLDHEKKNVGISKVIQNFSSQKSSSKLCEYNDTYLPNSSLIVVPKSILQSENIEDFNLPIGVNVDSITNKSPDIPVVSPTVLRTPNYNDTQSPLITMDIGTRLQKKPTMAQILRENATKSRIKMHRVQHENPCIVSPEANSKKISSKPKDSSSIIMECDNVYDRLYSNVTTSFSLRQKETLNLFQKNESASNSRPFITTISQSRCDALYNLLFFPLLNDVKTVKS